MLTKIYKKTKVISSLWFLVGFIAILIGGIVSWNRNRKKKGLSASEYFFNADTADLTDEELEDWNNEKKWRLNIC